MATKLFAAVAILVLVFVGVQAVPHAVQQEVPTNHSNASVPQDFGEMHVSITGTVAGIVPLALGAFATILFIGRLL
jgi:hypothetical protein